MRVMTAARERLYTSVVNRFPYNVYHVLNNVAFHGFIYNKNKRYQCVLCSDTLSSWGRNNGRACAQPEDLTELIKHADGHLLIGEARLPYETIATLLPSPEIFIQLFNANCWDQGRYMALNLKKLAEDAAVRERTFVDHPEAVAALHRSDTVEDCVTRGLWYNAPQRLIQCAFCPYSTNVLGVPHGIYHSDLTRCPRLIDSTPAVSTNDADETETADKEQHKQQVCNQLERDLATACLTSSMASDQVVPQIANATRTQTPVSMFAWPSDSASFSAAAAVNAEFARSLQAPPPSGFLSACQRLEGEGYSTERILQLLAKRRNEKLTTYEELKDFEQKVDGQHFLTLGPIERRCSICLTRSITAVADPCGHMQYCMPCLARLRRCAFCKKRITRKLRVFSPYS